MRLAHLSYVTRFQSPLIVTQTFFFKTNVYNKKYSLSPSGLWLDSTLESPPLLPTQDAKEVTWGGGGGGAGGSSPVHWKSGKLMTADALTGRVGGVGDQDGQSV